MRFIMKIKMGDIANDRLKDPEFGQKMQKLLSEIKAEAVYFTTICGNRGCFAVVQMNDASEMARVAEPFFLWLNAEIEWYPVMLPEDLAKAGPYIASAAKNWG
jgi:hypothetical protein